MLPANFTNPVAKAFGAPCRVVGRFRNRRRRLNIGRYAMLVMVMGLILSSVVGYVVVDAEPVDAAVTQDEGGASGCGSLPVISAACQNLVDQTSWLADCGLGGLDDCTSDITNSVVQGAFDYFAEWVAVGAIGAIDLVWDGITGTTTPVVGTSSTVFQTSVIAAKSLSVPLLVLAALYSLLRRDSDIALKSAFIYLPGSVFLMVVSGYFITALLAATDELSEAFLLDGETGVAIWLDDLGGVIGAGVGLTAPILLVIFSVILIVGSILVWLVMVVRTAAILVTYSFMPLAFAAMIFPATRSWIRRLIEIQMSFILAKPVIIAVMAIGAATLNDAGNALVGMMQASALFYLASFSPFALMKLLPFVGDEAVAAMEAPSKAPTGMASTTVGVVTGHRLAGLLSGSQQGGRPAPSAGPEAAGGMMGGGDSGPIGGSMSQPSSSDSIGGSSGGSTAPPSSAAQDFS